MWNLFIIYVYLKETLYSYVLCSLFHKKMMKSIYKSKPKWVTNEVWKQLNLYTIVLEEHCSSFGYKKFKAFQKVGA
jgi:hypothetical protein